MMSYLTLTIDLGGQTGQLKIINNLFNNYMLKMLESNSTKYLRIWHKGAKCLAIRAQLTRQVLT